MSQYYRTHPHQAQQKTYTTPVCKAAKWKLSEEQARRLHLPIHSENWSDDSDR